MQKTGTQKITTIGDAYVAISDNAFRSFPTEAEWKSTRGQSAGSIDTAKTVSKRQISTKMELEKKKKLSDVKSKSMGNILSGRSSGGVGNFKSPAFKNDVGDGTHGGGDGKGDERSDADNKFETDLEQGKSLRVMTPQEALQARKRGIECYKMISLASQMLYSSREGLAGSVGTCTPNNASATCCMCHCN